MKACGDHKFDTACLDGPITAKAMAEKPLTSLAIIMNVVRHAYTDDAEQTMVFSKCLERVPFSRLELSLVLSPGKPICDDVGVDNTIKKRSE